VPRGGGSRFRHRDRPFRPKIATAERPLLRFERGSTPEQLEGMSADSSGTTYLNVDELSDSDEQSMDESDAEGDASTEAAAGKDTKRVKLASDAKDSNDDAPKWSNAELYTALPPVEDATERKRRDVVKLIRKARVMASKDKAPVKPLEGDDFISFGFEDDEEQEAEAKPYSLHSVPLMPQQNSPLHVDASAIENRLADKESVASRLGEQGAKRKREEADLGGPLNVPRQKMGRSMTINSEILADWEERPDLNPTPWIDRDHRQTENCGFR
jgi:non-canonical poly(A) RNA polymerase PAPD5/7